MIAANLTMLLSEHVVDISLHHFLECKIVADNKINTADSAKK